MRVGQNPAKSIDHIPQPRRVTVAVVSYIPFLNGYYSGSLEVLQACLSSLWENTPTPYDLLVFDNASCPEVRAYLQSAHQAGRIQYLVLSDRNVGKGGAWNLIFQGAPGKVVAYADSDVYFYPGWLERSLALLDTFPRVGMVSSRPLRTPEKFYSATLEWAGQTPGVQAEKGQFMSWEVFKEHNDSLGVSEELARQWFGESIDWKLTYQGCCAYAGAAHFQFVAPKAVLQSLGPLEMDRPMGQVRSLDQKLNEAGYLRLNTCEPLVKHLGNRLGASPGESPGNPRLVQGSAAGPAVPSRNTPARAKTPRLVSRMAALAPIRRSLLWLYDQIFRLYYG